MSIPGDFLENLQVTGGVFQMTNTDNVPETPILDGAGKLYICFPDVS